MRSYKNIFNELLKCNKCGYCQEVCPTYRVVKEEPAVARGRVRLLRAALEDRFSFEKNPEMQGYLESCLSCKACVENCPSNVQVTKAVQWGKEELWRHHGVSAFVKLLYKNSFSKEGNFAVGARLINFYQQKGLRKLSQKLLLKVKALKELEEIVPEVPSKNFWQLLEQREPSNTPKKHKVIYYIGCGTKYFYPNVGLSLVKVLEKNNCEVIVPKLDCCGVPHLSVGFGEETKRLAMENLQKLYKIDADVIVTDCGTCGDKLKKYVEMFEEESNLYSIAAQVGEKVIDAMEFLVNTLGLENINKSDKRVTYHDPCHSVRGLKVKDAPRKLLQNAANYVEMKSASSCCGGAGIYGVKNKETSRAILAGKMKEFKDSGADVLCTSCPSCAIQLNLGLKLNKLQGKVMHPFELLAE
ncbi:MAG: (Fe-S)-binding protein [Bacillota bacterium]|nr:(Fe-S)-binding protein [Bacillota bacterium]